MSNKEKLKAVIFYIVNKLPSNITRTKLVKLLYLIDLDYAKDKGRRLTGLTYYSYYYGPYSEEIVAGINELKGYEIDEYSSISSDGKEYHRQRGV